MRHLLLRALTITTYAILLSQLPAQNISAKPVGQNPPPTYRVFPQSYAKVWNATVKLLFEDLQYAPKAADPEMGFISTFAKTVKGKGGAKDKRISLHVNVKKAGNGTIVTVRCEIEEFTPIPGTKQGRWMMVPSDNSCEADFLNLLSKKL